MRVKPMPKHIKYLREQAKELGGKIRVHEQHVTLLNVNGDIVGYFYSEEDHLTTFISFEKYEPRKGKQ